MWAVTPAPAGFPGGGRAAPEGHPGCARRGRPRPPPPLRSVREESEGWKGESRRACLQVGSGGEVLGSISLDPCNPMMPVSLPLLGRLGNRGPEGWDEVTQRVSTPRQNSPVGRVPSKTPRKILTVSGGGFHYPVR